MPYKFETEKTPLPREKDRRRKISDEDKDLMKTLRDQGLSYAKIAKAIGCSKRAVMFVINPEMQDRCKEQHKERRKDGRYYIKEKHTEQMREHRQYKHEVLKLDKGD